MLQLEKELNLMTRKLQRGFTLLETMVSLVVLLAVSGIVMTGMIRMMTTQGTVANRTEMHTSVRSATELLQQEIGQAGRISLTAPGVNVTLAAAVAAAPGQAISLSPASATSNLFVGETLDIDAGPNQETVTVTGTDAAPTATFVNAHAAGAAAWVVGAFANGIVPPSVTCAGTACGSTGTKLKLFGDINGDGNMVYIEYTCDTSVVPGFLYRQQVPFNAAATAKVNPPTAAMALLTNVLANPPGANATPSPCFNYQTQTVGTTDYVVDVQITLTERTQLQDQVTHAYQNETKALLNVAPRNVVDAWRLANHKYYSRVQVTPDTVISLLP